jgi:hypothetical protein
MPVKKNCWELKNCGREPGGGKTNDMGVCPASTNSRLHGVHGGINSGRACWVVSGTMCDGEIQGTFANKFSSCKQCEVCLLVKEEETPAFKLSATLMSMLR